MSAHEIEGRRLLSGVFFSYLPTAAWPVPSRRGPGVTALGWRGIASGCTIRLWTMPKYPPQERASGP